MRVAPRGRGRASHAAAVAGSLTLLAVVLGSLPTPAEVQVTPGLQLMAASGLGPPTASTDLMAVLGAAAASGAGDAAVDYLGDDAEKAVQAAAVVATTTTPAGKALKIPAAYGAPFIGWQSGAAGIEASDGSFAAWRGKSLGIVSVWCDTGADAQTNMDAVGQYANYNGQMDIAVGGLVRGETWDQAASGAFVDRWTTAMRNVKRMRAGKGTTYIRIAHEFNGDWEPWGVTRANMASYKKGYRLYASIVRKEFPEAKLTWSPNGSNHTTATIDELYPGADVVDVIGPDMYDGYPPVTSQAVWNAGVNKWLSAGSPTGMQAWVQYATTKGKPLGLPEWGMQGGDHPIFIKGMHDVIAANAAKKGSQAVAGKFVYDSYFNVEQKFKLLNGSAPQASAMYVSLTWGS